MSWLQYHAIVKEAAAEREYWATTDPLACPRCGEPLTPGPPSAGDVISFCSYDGWQNPRDYVRPALR